MKRPPLRILLMDACVLIDFCKAERSVLRKCVLDVGEIHVITPVLQEVKEFQSEQELLDLGLILDEPELEDALSAAEGRGPVSFQDRLCLLTAKRNRCTCVTNDKSLRKLCALEGVPVMWGLQLLLELLGAGGISPKEAVNIAETIHRANPRHITASILSRFIENVHQRKGE